MKNQQSEPVEIEVMVHRMSDLAFMVSNDGNERAAVWLPKSQVISRDILRSEVAGEVCILTVPQWLAKQNDLSATPLDPGVDDMFGGGNG